MFPVIFLEIYNLSIMRNPPYLKAEIYLRKFNTNLKFQRKFLIVKPPGLFIHFLLCVRVQMLASGWKIWKSLHNMNFRVIYMNCFFKYPASGAPPPKSLVFSVHIYSFILLLLCLRSKICLHHDEKCAHFFMEFSNFFRDI